MQELRSKRITFIVVVAVSALAATAYANHSWGGFHWARTANPFTVKLGDNLASVWKPHLSTASADWTKSAVLNTVIVPGQASTRPCKATLGRVEICNDAYGNTGWLGIASISITSAGHITKGTVKVNDTYFNTAKYNKPEWRQLVMCQEVGHTFGLDHQDEVFGNANLGTCMDYTDNPLGPLNNEHPNQHDYDELAIIYAHLDSSTTVGQTAPVQVAARNEDDDELPQSVAMGRTKSFIEDLGNGNQRLTFIFWAPDAP